MLESMKQNGKGIFLMLLSSICVCVGQLFWKLSVKHGIGILVLGFLFYGLGALIMIVAYRFGKLSVLQPMLSLNYILSLILASIVLKETIDFWKYMGVIIIIVGVLLIAGGDEA